MKAARNPLKPLMIWDGDCLFCRRWIELWKSYTGDQIDYETFESSLGQFPEVTGQGYRESVLLIETDGEIYRGAEAVFRTLSRSNKTAWLLNLYRRAGIFRVVSEKFYSIVASNRSFFSQVTRLLWGNHLGPATFAFSSSLFVKGLGLIYCFAFLSLAVQIHGLVGSHGIMPAADYLRLAHEYYGPAAFFKQPTIFWINSSDFAFTIVLCLGIAASVLILLGRFLPAALAAAWFIYLSFVNIGQDFTSFQWDSLLLEAGLLTIFFVPWKAVKNARFFFEPNRLMRLLYSWLIFRLVYFSGVGKIRSGDPTWGHLTALHYHFETQPLPSPLAWHMHHMPDWFLGFEAALVLILECAVPFLIFAPRMLRHLAAIAMIFFQAVIILSGNFGFFNLLSIALCFLLFDDPFWPEFIKRKLFFDSASVQKVKLNKVIRGLLLGFVLLMTSGNLPRIFCDTELFWPRSLEPIRKIFKPLHSFNQYGLFTVMTTTRPELQIEGSYNRITWEPYEFKFKPGDPKKGPIFNVPHQPRLDWQMWFAALGTYHESPWLSRLSQHLLKGTPSVLKLFKKNPFTNGPPRYIRAVLYDYRFSTPAERKSDSVWWVRERKGLFMPVITLNKDR